MGTHQNRHIKRECDALFSMFLFEVTFGMAFHDGYDITTHHNMKILYFHLPYFLVSNSALFLHGNLVIFFHIDIPLTLSWTWIRIVLYIIIKMSIAQYITVEHVYIIWCCIFGRLGLLIWTICASHQRDYLGWVKYQSSIGQSEMAFHDMKRYIIVHYYKQHQFHSKMLYSTYTLIDVIIQRGICYISGRWALHYISGQVLHI